MITNDGELQQAKQALQHLQTHVASLQKALIANGTPPAMVEATGEATFVEIAGLEADIAGYEVVQAHRAQPEVPGES